ncbi:MAG TPA: acetate/propionate family kinase [Solirubrobacteraceae bacterium]|nr:acetate/propionate family kinase [Solirubrobacteraceae bacterium]
MRVLVANAGSSSLKLALLDGRRTLASCTLAQPQAPVVDGCLRQRAAAAVAEMLTHQPSPEAVGHRIVHGGGRFSEALLIDQSSRRKLEALVELAPLHLRPALAVVDALREALPSLPAVACFDTAFHRTLPAAAATYALPEGWRKLYGVRRFGFHGLSHAWVARSVARELRRDGGPAARIISAHLGAGASLCAIARGRSLDTTMGFTPLEGLVMATRPGSVDPGAITWLARKLQRTEGPRRALETLEGALEHQSGLQALAGSAEMSTILERAAGGEERAQLARDVYIHRLTGAIAQMAASLGGVDAIAFTGGVGENAPEIRELALRPLAFIGAALDERANRAPAAAAVREIGAPGAAVRIFVVRAREDLEIARQVRALLGAGRHG